MPTAAGAPVAHSEAGVGEVPDSSGENKMVELRAEWYEASNLASTLINLFQADLTRPGIPITYYSYNLLSL